MHLKSIIVLSAAMLVFFCCNNKSSTATKASFCDTVCMQDSVNFIDNNNKLKPYVYISAKNCSGDTLTWGFIGQNKNIPFDYKLNKDFTRCYIKDTSFALPALTISGNFGFFSSVRLDWSGSPERFQ